MKYRQSKKDLFYGTCPSCSGGVGPGSYACDCCGFVWQGRLPRTTEVPTINEICKVIPFGPGTLLGVVHSIWSRKDAPSYALDALTKSEVCHTRSPYIVEITLQGKKVLVAQTRFKGMTWGTMTWGESVIFTSRQETNL